MRRSTSVDSLAWFERWVISHAGNIRHRTSNNVQAHVRVRVTDVSIPENVMRGNARQPEEQRERHGRDVVRNGRGAQSPPDETLAIAATADAAETPGLVEALLFSLRTEEPSVSQLTQDSRPLHLGLEPLQKLVAVFSITECNVCQFSLLQNKSGGSFDSPD